MLRSWYAGLLAGADFSVDAPSISLRCSDRRCYICEAIVAEEKPKLTLRRLFPFPSAGAISVEVSQIIEELALEARERKGSEAPLPRPYVLLNMASTVDGRASIEGRAGPIGDRADSELLHGLRTIVDGLLVGAHTVRVERYARLLRNAQERRIRRERGLSEELPTFIVSRSLDIDPQNAPLLAEPAAVVTVVTPSSDALPAAGASPAPAATLDVMRCEHDGRLDLAAALRRMRAEHGVETLLCEGGPRLAAQLLAAGLLDELFLCVAPKLAGGDRHLRILAGGDLHPPQEISLISLHEHDSYLFLRYRLGG